MNLEITELSEFQNLSPKSFHSWMVDKMKEFFKNSCFILKRRQLATALVVYEEVLSIRKDSVHFGV